ncbi:hypothetical protein [Aneurinibacillus uraniidurans]|uniref:hypothetical protein n=1 Tax=Aneurinibacillus uraniidurans TaxID=2966586 RepID=UPI003BEF4223
MSFPNIPDVTAKISVTVGQTIPLLLASIAFEELALAHIMNAEAEKIQFVLGTLEPSRPLASTSDTPTVTISNILDINRSVNQTLQTVIKKEMLLQFKLENILENISVLVPTTPPTPPSETCQCSVSFNVPANSPFTETLDGNPSVSGTGQLGKNPGSSARVMICQQCDPTEADLFFFEFTPNSGAAPINFEATSFTPTAAGTLGTCCSDNGVLRFTISGTGLRTENGIETAVGFTLVLEGKSVTLTLNGNEVFAGTVPGQGNIHINSCGGFNPPSCS